MKKINQLYLLALLLPALQLQAQLPLGIGTQQPNASALLHLESTNRGLLIPVMNATNLHRISNPSEGLILFDATNRRFRYRSFFTWRQLPDGTPQRIWPLSGVDFENQEDFRIGSNNEMPLVFRVNGHSFGLIGYGSEAGLYIGLNSGASLGLRSTGTVAYGTGSGGSARLSAAVGHSALASSQSNHIGLVAIGRDAMQHVRGTQHIGIGVEAYQGSPGNTTGNIPNIAIGTRALRNATTAAGNIALGHEAMANNSTAQGNIAILSSTNGTRNIAIRAPEVNGTDQIVIAAGTEFTGGSGNIMINAAGNPTQKYTSSHNIMIDAGDLNTLLASDAEEVIIGGTSATSPQGLNPRLSTRNQGASFTANLMESNGAVMIGLSPLQGLTSEMGVGIGAQAVRVGTRGVAVGNLTQALTNSVALGHTARVGDNSVTIGWNTGNIGFGNDLVLIGAGVSGNSTTGDRGNQMVMGNSNMTAWLFGRNTTATNRALLVGTNTTNGNAAGLTSGGAWMSTSDVNTKEAFTVPDKKEILEKLAQLSVTRWKYKGTNEYHIGPMAQDFFAAFGLGTSDKHISAIDPAGLTTLAIQAIMERIAELENELAALETAE